MKELTRERIEELLKPGMIFQEDGTVLSVFPLKGEIAEDIAAAHRVGFLGENIDRVIEEINAKRRACQEPESAQEQDNPKKTPANISPLVDLFGIASVLYGVNLEINGAKIRIDKVEL